MAKVDIRTLRKSRGLNQSELGEIIGVSQKRVSAMEITPETMSLAQFEAMLDGLGYSFSLHANNDWQNPTGDKSTQSASVYVLPHLTLPAIKIGKAVHLLTRTQTIDGADPSRAMELITDSEKEAFNVERILHRAFKKWRLSTYEAAKMGMGESGSSEWFHSACHEQVMQFAQANAGFLGYRIAPVAA